VQENDKPVLIYSTFPTPEAAAAVGNALVEGRLAACVNIIPGMTSIYRWEGKIAKEAGRDRRGATAPPLHQPGAHRYPARRWLGRLPRMADAGDDARVSGPRPDLTDRNAQ
jgi:hypothetical protein